MKRIGDLSYVKPEEFDIEGKSELQAGRTVIISEFYGERYHVVLTQTSSHTTEGHVYQGGPEHDHLMVVPETWFWSPGIPTLAFLRLTLLGDPESHLPRLGIAPVVPFTPEQTGEILSEVMECEVPVVFTM